jgi:multidrug efflux pump
VVLVFAVLMLCLIPVLLKFTRNELAPDEDQGMIFMMSSSPQTANLDYLNAYTDEFTPIFRTFPEYYSSFQINGFNGVQTGIGGFLLKPWNERKRTQMRCCRWCRPSFHRSPACRSSASTCPPARHR